MLVFKHPKYYQEMRKRAKKFQKEQADKRASEQANERASEQADSDQASEEDASNKRWMWSQSLIAREGVSRWSSRRPGIELLSYNFTSLREGL